MLTITLPATEELPELKLNLEHSLVSLSKWESIHEKAFFGREPMDHELTVSYIQQMVLDFSPEEDWISRLEQEDYDKITDYLNSKQSATWFREEGPTRGPREIITAELIYYWMIGFQIPFKPCEDWHINRLMTLIKICGIKQTKPKKMSRQAQAAEYRRLNQQRREQLGSAG
jgi:hypothetical protein